MNLKTKFHLASSCLILTVVIGTMLSLVLSERTRLKQEIERQQADELDKLARVCADSMIVFDEPALINYAKNLVNMTGPKLAYAGVIYENSADGSPWIWGYGSESISYVDPKDESVDAISKSGRLLKRHLIWNGQKITELSRPVEKIGYARLGYSDATVAAMLRETIKKSIRRFSVIGLIAIFFGLILAHLFSAALARPINLLMQGADAIAKGQKGIKVPEGSNDELGQLTRTFNRMSEELIKLDQLKDDFMSHVTHELRSPLTSIIATVELMSEMPVAGTEPKLRRSIDRLIYGSERLNRLVDNILDLTRMEAGKMPFDIQPVNIGKILCEMADFFEPRTMEKGLKIRAIVPRRFPLVMADPERIRQVISNLIHNAIKFTNKGGLVLWVKEKDGLVQVGIQDTGVGIPKDKLDSVFKKFECLKDTRDRVDKPVPGSGLGLNIVLNSIKSQGGQIWVESEVDKGSTFIFTLPLAPADLQEKAHSESSDNAAGMSVMPKVTQPRQAVVMTKMEKAS